jgi:hypothetical protein
MRKNEILLKIEDFRKSNIDWQYESFAQDGITIGIGAYFGDTMIDEHIVQKFPELELIELYDEMEGFLSYYGNDSVENIREKLLNMGFNAIIVKNGEIGQEDINIDDIDISDLWK